ncbi:MAG TPA: DUF1598 domain-containing protein, partial [Pirellulales bacterium]|nr:DUF1598 domain-containing protein [Pirellulales bacterium]
MWIKRARLSCGRWRILAASTFVWALVCWGISQGVSTTQAQNLGFGFVQAVGGVYVDGMGVVKDVQHDEFDQLKEIKVRDMHQVPDGLMAPIGLRKISLRQMQSAISEARNAGKQMPDEVRYLAGIQRIQYVFVYPEQKDIVLAGFGEGWRVDRHGNMVGKTTGRPVIELDDLLVALRSAESAAQGGISCSIDPTKEGLQKLQAYMQTVNVGTADPQDVARNMEQELGPQTVTFRGVPDNSHYAAVLLAADYRMKRIAMAFEKSPVNGLPSYLSMPKGNAGAFQNVLPRWWLASDYEPLLTDAEGLAWELRGQGVKTMTEDEMLAADGTRKALGKASPQAAKWAKMMTDKYDELSTKEPIFGELRNCIDLAVISALIVKENLAGKSGCDLSLLLDPDRAPLRLQ